MTEHALETRDLGKTFYKRRTVREFLRAPLGPRLPVRALDGVTLSVRRGEIFGLLGPNGAGKTTLIKILSGLVLPSEGQASIEGCDASRGAESRRRLGLVIADDRSFYWRLTGLQNLRFFGRLHDIPEATLGERIKRLLDRLDLGEVVDRPFSSYSTGTRQRLAVARALLHEPAVLLLDEPTRSLDPVAARSLRRFVTEELAGRDGKTILIATHNLHEAESLCARIAIIARGRIIASGPPASIRRLGLPAERYRIECRGPLPEAGEGWTIEAPGPDGSSRVEVALRSGETLDPALRRIQAAGAEIVSCDRLEPDLEEAFERIVAGGGAAS